MNSLESLLYCNPKAELASRNFEDFVEYMFDDYSWNWHHRYICHKLQQFADGKIKKLAIFVPPQHGKSELASRLFPAYKLGKNPDARIAGVSYAHSLSAKFNRSVQRYIDSAKYREIFANSQLYSMYSRSASDGAYLRNSDEFEIVGYKGGYISVGIGGGLTGNKVDLLIIDDPVKDAVEAGSPAFQARNWEWYNSVASTRLNNNAQQLLIQTRWDSNDLGGMILRNDPEFEVIVIRAIKEDMAHDCEGRDPRKLGEALWEKEHSREKILGIKERSPKTYFSLYQQEPQDPTDILVFARNSEMTTHPLPSVSETYYACDFGFSNSQTGVCKFQLDVENKVVYAEEVIYELGYTNHDIALALREDEIGNKLLICDSAEPKSIQELIDPPNNLNAIPCPKFQNSVLTMILYLKSWQLVLKGAGFEFEVRKYKWKINAEGKPINKEVDAHNHLFKALMYGVYQIMEGSSVSVGEDEAVSKPRSRFGEHANKKRTKWKRNKF
ncbi:MAG: terminase large subunit [Thermonemataceae bacterium]